MNVAIGRWEQGSFLLRRNVQINVERMRDQHILKWYTISNSEQKVNREKRWTWTLTGTNGNIFINDAFGSWKCKEQTCEKGGGGCRPNESQSVLLLHYATFGSPSIERHHFLRFEIVHANTRLEWMPECTNEYNVEVDKTQASNRIWYQNMKRVCTALMARRKKNYHMPYHALVHLQCRLL